MAISTTAVLEMRPDTGSNTNGGFYKSDAGTTDYSQQDAAELTLTDIATNGAGTGLSSVTGGWTAQMVGNGIYLNGASPGWYEITAYTDTNNITIDRSAGASQSGLTGSVGGAVSFPTDAMWELFGGGKDIHLKDGTATLTGNINIGSAGSSNKHSRVIGYKNTRGDNPRENDRPLIAGGANTFQFTHYWSFYNIQVTGTGINVFDTRDETIIKNCSAINTSVTANRVALAMNRTQSVFARHAFDCYGESTNGTAFALDANCKIESCVAKDSSIGVGQTEASSVDIKDCLVYNCVTGIKSDGRYGTEIVGNTIHNCSTYGINIANCRNVVVRKNSISGCGKGIYSTNSVPDDTGDIDYNNLWDNTTDYDGVTAGDHDTAKDPEYTDPDTGDFNVSANMSVSFAYQSEGTTENYNTGAVQSTRPTNSGGWGI